MIGVYYGQIFNADGTKNGSEFPVNTYTTNSQGYPSAASLSNDQFVVTWMSLNQDGEMNGVFGQIFNAEIIPTSSTTSTTTSSSSSIIQSKSNTNEVSSGAERYTNSIALTAFTWIAQTIKGVFRVLVF